MIYTTKDNETLDYICWKYYGKSSGYVERVLEANKHLAEEPANLSAGIKINLPEISEPENNQKIKLWN